MPNSEHTDPETSGSGVFEERFSMLVAHIGPGKPEASQVAAIAVLQGVAAEAPWLADRVRGFFEAQRVHGGHTDHVASEIDRALAGLP